MKTRTTFTLTILLAALLAAPSGVSAKRRGGSGGEGDSHRRKGVELAEAKQYAEAIEEFNKEVQAAPNDPSAYHDRGPAYRAAGRAAEAAGDGATSAMRYTSAITDFSKMIELAPKDASGYIERAQAEIFIHQNDTALADTTKALELKPNDPLAIKFRGYA